MKPITLWESSDGMRFNNPDRCHEYELLQVECTTALTPLGTQPDNLPTWHFVQHSETAYRAAVRSVQKILYRLYPDMRDNLLVHYGSYTARVVSESDKKCLVQAYQRLCRISEDTFREYNQTYCVANEAARLAGTLES